MTTELTMHWVSVLDSRGRSRMEARWAPAAEATIRTTRTQATHAPTPHAA